MYSYSRWYASFFFLSQFRQNKRPKQVNNDFPGRIDARTSARGRRADNEVSHGTKIHHRGVRSRGVPAASASRHQNRPLAVSNRGELRGSSRIERTARGSKQLDAKQIAVRRFPGSAAPNTLLHSQLSPSCRPDRLVQM